ncbi:MAG: MFS transporter [Actinobacteria bacterium]|nr:MFS transporter [Actinomycetota bacterium]MBU1943531.1 MFS transporter [Actinomycetota bacterium]MBU2687540.1 MFS transporter [Actinomycetota bacterium]
MEGEGIWRRAGAFFPLMIVPGIVLLLAPSTVHKVMEYFGFRESLGGLLQVSYFVGGVVGILLITRLMQRFTVKQITLSQAALLCVSLLASAVCPWYPLLLVLFLVVGIANGILIAFPGIYVTRVCGEASHRAQNLLYGFFSLGVLSGPLIARLVMGERPEMWRWVFAVPALMIIPLSVPVAVAHLERLEGVRVLSLGVLRDILAERRKLFIGLFVALLLYIAAESAVSMWIIRFFDSHYSASNIGAWVLTALWASLTVGRWICGWLSKRVDPYHILLFLTISSALTVLIAPMTGSRTAAELIYPLVGLFYSGIYPMLIGYVAWFPAELSSAVFSVFLAAGAVGGAVLPYFVGLTNQFGGYVVGMASISLPLFGVLACLIVLRGELVGAGPELACGTDAI